MNSRLVLEQKEFPNDSKVTCKATHNGKSYSGTTSICSAYPLSVPSIQLETPRFRTVMEQKVVTATCVVQTAVNAKIYWLQDGKDIKTGITESRTGQNIISNLTLQSDQWKELNNITCKAEDHCFKFTQKTINVKGATLKTPTVVIRRSLQDLLNNDRVVLECYITQLSSSDFYVNLEVNGRELYDKQYVDLPISKTTHSITRHFSLQKPHLKNNTFKCKLCQGFSKTWESNSLGKLFEEPSIQLYVVPTNMSSHSENQKLVCSGWGLNPKIKWLSESKQIPAAANDVRMGEDGRVAVTSYITVTAKEWKEGNCFTCEVIDNELDKLISENISICEVTPASSQKVGVYLHGPPLQNLGTDGQVPVTCLLVGPSLGDFSVSWKVGGASQKGDKQFHVEHSNGTETLQIMINVSATSWHAYQIVSCEVKHRCSIQAQVEHISKCRDPKPPSIKLVGPSDSDVLGSENATMLCLVSGFFPSEVIVLWKHGGSDLPSSRYSNSPSVQYVGSSTFSMNSRLIVPKSEWDQNSTYTCVVKHESSDIPINSTIENVFGSVMTSPPTATLLQGTKELVCLVFGFSPSSINITWLLDNVTELSEHITSTPYRGPDGKHTVWSHLSLAPQDWAPGAVYTCRVTHPTKTLSVNTSKPEIMEEGVLFDLNMFDPIGGDGGEDNWKMAFNFIILFLFSLLYSIILTLAKAKS
ncbi:hypothetical protein UPYG_G00104380 [Umbra pygmaea]|uniref:Ig-like domain-containing protein n=1 Tax=Umbra pygmaea TaxID=75934 RepID=A0ABD0X2J0_UMBPY